MKYNLVCNLVSEIICWNFLVQLIKHLISVILLMGIENNLGLNVMSTALHTACIDS